MSSHILCHAAPRGREDRFLAQMFVLALREHDLSKETETSMAVVFADDFCPGVGTFDDVWRQFLVVKAGKHVLRVCIG